MPQPSTSTPGSPSDGESGASAAVRRVSSAELSRITVEVVAGAGEAGVALDELKRRVAAALDEPLPSTFQEQLDVLLTNEYVERDEDQGIYRLTDQGGWLVQGIEVVNG